MEHRRLDQLEGVAHVVEEPLAPVRLTYRERCERWAQLLERHPGPLRTIEGIEYGDLKSRSAKRADNSPLWVAFKDPTLRAAGLAGDTVGDATAFFGLSRMDIHGIVCDCHHGRTVAPTLAASHLRMAARRAAGSAQEKRAAVFVAGASAVAVVGLLVAAF